MEPLHLFSMGRGDGRSHRHRERPRTQADAALSAREEGNLAFAAGDLSAAVEAYSVGLKMDPGNPVLLNNRAAVHLRLERWAEAEADATAAAAARPRWAKAWVRVGQARLQLNRAKEASAAFETALKIDSSLSEGRSGLSSAAAKIAGARLVARLPARCVLIARFCPGRSSPELLSTAAHLIAVASAEQGALVYAISRDGVESVSELEACKAPGENAAAALEWSVCGRYLAIAGIRRATSVYECRRRLQQRLNDGLQFQKMMSIACSCCFQSHVKFSYAYSQGQDARDGDAGEPAVGLTSTIDDRVVELREQVFVDSIDFPQEVLALPADQEINVWSLTSGQRIEGGCPHPAVVTDVAVSHSRLGHHIATASADGLVRIWNRKGGELVFALSCRRRTGRAGSEGAATAVRLIEDYDAGLFLVIAAFYDLEIRVGELLCWDLTKESPEMTLKSLSVHDGKIESIDYCPTSRVLAVGSADGVVRALRMSQLCRQVSWAVVLETLGDHMHSAELSSSVTCVRLFSWRSEATVQTWLATGGVDGSIRVWDVDSAECLEQLLHQHTRPVNFLDWSTDGRYLASVGGGSALVWNTQDVLFGS